MFRRTQGRKGEDGRKGKWRLLYTSLSVPRMRHPEVGGVHRHTCYHADALSNSIMCYTALVPDW